MNPLARDPIMQRCDGILGVKKWPNSKNLPEYLR